MPFVRVTLKSLRRKEYDFGAVTIGQHVLRQRLLRGISQHQAGLTMGVASWTVLNWEKGRTHPPISAYPAIARFLGYELGPVDETLGQRMLAARKRHGWTISAAAAQLGVDPGTWNRWERSGRVAWKRHYDALERFLARTFRKPPTGA